MKRLSLDSFKEQANSDEIAELENLTGGILGACHPCDECVQLRVTTQNSWTPLAYWAAHQFHDY